MEEKFKTWLIRAEGKQEPTGISYSRAINRLSEHHSQFTGNSTDIYSVDLKQLEQIKNSYESNGRFSEVGHQSHGLNRAAIKAFYRFKLATLETPLAKVKMNSEKHSIIRKKAKRKNIAQRIVTFFNRLFQRQKEPKVSSGNFMGTKKQVLKLLLPILPTWEKEVHEKYLIANPSCKRCKSMEFPVVMERQPINTKNFLELVLKDFPKNQKQTVSISALEGNYKNQVELGDRLMVLCRTCKQKEEDRKVERFRHEVPPIMRKGPPELKY